MNRMSRGTRFVVDASVAIKWVIPELDSDSAVTFLKRSPLLLVPDLFFCEISNVLWKRSLRGDINPQFAEKSLQILQGLPFETHPTASLAGSALKLALIADCSVYDAFYLILAAEQACRMVTADREFYQSMMNKLPGDHLVWIGDITGSEISF